jgi:hypothetical protein
MMAIIDGERRRAPTATAIKEPARLTINQRAR